MITLAQTRSSANIDQVGEGELTSRGVPWGEPAAARPHRIDEPRRTREGTGRRTVRCTECRAAHDIGLRIRPLPRSPHCGGRGQRVAYVRATRLVAHFRYFPPLLI